jgi:hypothetical protein
MPERDDVAMTPAETYAAVNPDPNDGVRAANSGIELDPTRIRDISAEFLDEDGRLRILPASAWAATTAHERALFGHRHAIYGFPTVELVEWLQEFIGERKAIEIGSGTGVLAEAVGIIGTDSHQQSKPEYRAHYQVEGQPSIRYGADVKLLDAREAVRRYRPQVVVAQWVTHKYERRRHFAEGNIDGVNEEDVLERCDQYVFIGNTKVHKGKSLWVRPHTLLHPPFVYSRASNGSPDFIAIWPPLEEDN